MYVCITLATKWEFVKIYSVTVLLNGNKISKAIYDKKTSGQSAKTDDELHI